MRFNRHSKLDGRHATLSPSNFAWIRYDDEKLERVFVERLQAARGTDEHAFAAHAIRLGEKLPDLPRTLNMYVNESIGFRLKPEIILYWSDICFGTADAIGYNERDKILRISDLKTGKTATKMDQLEVYAALFCLEYEFPKPWEIDIELRIYQSNNIKFELADPDKIIHIMDRIITGDRILENLSAELF